MIFFFFFKQKTAYEMRISDWSSDVCSSDLYIKNLKGQEAVLVFSGPNNLRKEVWEDYKANRKASRKPLCYWTIIDHLRAEGRYRVLSEDCLEGDDYIGILATRTSPMYRVLVRSEERRVGKEGVRTGRSRWS